MPPFLDLSVCEQRKIKQKGQIEKWRVCYLLYHQLLTILLLEPDKTPGVAVIPTEPPKVYVYP